MAFQNEVWTPMEVIHKSLNLSNACCKGREVSAPLHSGEQKIASKGSISRSFPQQGEVVLNCDGAVTNAACSGVIRDHMGAYLCGFGAYIGSASVLKAELMAILFGFKLAWSRGFRKIRVESDSLNAIRLIPGQGSNLRPCYDII
ncbi:uncharacterized protein LOC114412814 [Glycine soja]|uniref:uncharacterized protein LOC114412814 n=1 Tax=Glycine soja TaxID=3848 RepID=UPI00103AEF46|nr:uncharacterized protein LOC114412814 [Glycine soja]